MHAATASARYSPARLALQLDGSPRAPKSPAPARRAPGGGPRPSPGFPPGVRTAERAAPASRPELLGPAPAPVLETASSPLLGSHHSHSGSGVRGFRLPPRPAAPAQGRPEGQRSRETAKSACAGHARCSIEAPRGVGGDLRSVGGAIGQGLPAASGAGETSRGLGHRTP